MKMPVEEFMKEDEREVYRMNKESSGILLSQIDKPNPIICPICKGPFMNAIVTNCNHYFCNGCAKLHHEKKDTCFVCDEETLGFFNPTMRLFFRETVEPKKMTEERDSAKAKKRMVLEMLNDTLKMANGSKRRMVSEMLKEAVKTTNESKKKMVNVETAVKIAEKVEMMLKRAIEKATEARETEIGEFIMVEEAMATVKKSTVEMEKAFEVMINLN